MPFYAATIVVLVVDQLSKFLALYYLKPLSSLELIPGLFRLYYATNTGGAFSILSDNTGILIFFSSVATILIFAWQLTLHRKDWVMKAGLGMIFGGAIGNLIDRFSRGLVIDFFDVHWRYRVHWPTFNFADTFICIGVGIIIVCTLFPHIHQKLVGELIGDTAPAEQAGSDAQHTE